MNLAEAENPANPPGTGTFAAAQGSLATSASIIILPMPAYAVILAVEKVIVKQNRIESRAVSRIGFLQDEGRTKTDAWQAFLSRVAARGLPIPSASIEATVLLGAY
jgi:hypothetical protein